MRRDGAIRQSTTEPPIFINGNGFNRRADQRGPDDRAVRPRITEIGMGTVQYYFTLNS
ncbi:hypothetical protein [Nocardia sp. NPDC051981]|uniref:hypothetical protein n=1 Tax=Nocardia sp. NPDC051981 TaxID=3155417 RepID=UPI003415E2BA